jgi:hypothetical protein
MQHVSVKIFVAGGDSPRLADAIPAFHRWIQKRDLPELLIDVADYSHVPAGPGVVLIGHEANYSLDNARNRPGLLYSRKVADGSLKQAYDAALAASLRLEAEPEFQGKLHFDSREIEITLNDRLLYPNTETGWNSVESELTAFLNGLYGAGAYSLARSADPRERLSVTVTADAALPI